MRLAAGFALLFLVSIPASAKAGQIDLSAFMPAATIQNFESLGSASSQYTTPLVIGNDTYDADDHTLISSSKLGPVIGRSGVAIANDAQRSNALIGFLDIVLGQPTLKAGMYVGFEFPWAADVQFYGPGDNLLGTLSLVGNGKDNHFAAWQADAGTIGRIRVVDMINNERSIIVDDFIQEVPEPLSISNSLLVILICLGFRHRRRAEKVSGTNGTRLSIRHEAGE